MNQRCLGPCQLVADVANGHNIFGCACVFLDLIAQMANMDVDDPRIAKEMIVPYTVQQLLTAKHFAAVTAKEEEQLEFLRREFDRLAFDLNFALLGDVLDIRPISWKPILIWNLAVIESGGRWLECVESSS